MKDVISRLIDDLKVNPLNPLVLSISGGIDSMSLLSLLLDGPFELVIVHFNHLKRDESIIEKDMVESFAKKHNIPFHYYTIEVQNGNFHHQAHLLRHHYLCEVARLYKTPYIVTAHHLDDLFENILIKITRGSNLLGYAGMQMKHTDSVFTYLKPLLYVSKEELVDYATNHHVPYLNDASNEENYYLRNRYRHAIVPIMKQENPEILEQIKQYHQQISSAFHFIRKTSISKISKDHKIKIDIFMKENEVIQDDMIAYLIERNKISFTFQDVIRIKKMLFSKKPNQSYALNKDYAFVKSYNESFVSLIKIIKPIKLTLKEGVNKIQNIASFTLFINSNTNTADLDKLCYNELAFPLWLRHREDGDLLEFSYGHKKLKKLLIEKKISKDKRDHLLVLTDQNNKILWVEDLYKNQTLGEENTLYFKIKR
jgi:bifunctional protein TilS/HprT